MKPCVCVVIVLFVIQSQDSGFVWVFITKHKSTFRPQFFTFLFYGFSGPISDVGGQKKLK